MLSANKPRKGDTMKLNEYLKECRVGMTQGEAAEKIGVSVNTIQNWESGTSCPSVDNLAKINKVYKCDTQKLLKSFGATVIEAEANKEIETRYEFLNDSIINLFVAEDIIQAVCIMTSGISTKEQMKELFRYAETPVEARELYNFVRSLPIETEVLYEIIEGRNFKPFHMQELTPEEILKVVGYTEDDLGDFWCIKGQIRSGRCVALRQQNGGYMVVTDPTMVKYNEPHTLKVLEYNHVKKEWNGKNHKGEYNRSNLMNMVYAPQDDFYWKYKMVNDDVYARFAKGDDFFFIYRGYTIEDGKIEYMERYKEEVAKYERAYAEYKEKKSKAEEYEALYGTKPPYIREPEKPSYEELPKINMLAFTYKGEKFAEFVEKYEADKKAKTKYDDKTDMRLLKLVGETIKGYASVGTIIAPNETNILLRNFVVGRNTYDYIWAYGADFSDLEVADLCEIEGTVAEVDILPDKKKSIGIALKDIKVTKHSYPNEQYNRIIKIVSPDKRDRYAPSRAD